MAPPLTSNTSLPHRPHRDDDDNSNLFQNYSMNGKIIISALGILFCMVFIIILLHIYSKWCWRRRSSMHHRALSRLRISLSSIEETCTKASALDKAVVEALPIFTYTPQLFLQRKGSFGVASVAAATTSADAAKAAECAVCLAEFRQDDTCKLLPNCKHFFHVACIDMWFLSHATCPLCRATPGLLLGDEEAGYSSSHAEDGCCGDEQGKEAHKGIRCVPPADGQDDEFPLNMGVSSQARKWRRSFSDKFPCTGKDHACMAPPMRERALTSDNLRCQDSLGAFSSCSSMSYLVSPPPLTHPHVNAPALKISRSLTRVFSK